MDFTPRRLHTFPSNVPIPFYMTYPGYTGGRNEQEVLRDLEYLQQTYPTQVRQYQRKVAEILDKIDYEGSMIYDEYPDKFMLYHTCQKIRKDVEPEMQTQNVPDRFLDEMIQVLLYQEIGRRRCRRHRCRRFW